MNGLLNSIQTGEPGEDRVCLPEIERLNDGLAVLRIVGAIDAVALCGIECQCARLSIDQSISSVWLMIDSLRSTWCVQNAVDAVKSLAERKTVLALIENAIGLAYALATPCRGIFAVPTARIGRFATFKADWSDAAPTCDQYDEVTIDGLLSYEPRDWRRLLQAVVNGETAEAMSVVDALLKPDTVNSHLRILT